MYNLQYRELTWIIVGWRSLKESSVLEILPFALIHLKYLRAPLRPPCCSKLQCEKFQLSSFREGRPQSSWTLAILGAIFEAIVAHATIKSYFEDLARSNRVCLSLRDCRRNSHVAMKNFQYFLLSEMSYLLQRFSMS